jgi:hypothetical protein
MQLGKEEVTADIEKYKRQNSIINERFRKLRAKTLDAKAPANRVLRAARCKRLIAELTRVGAYRSFRRMAPRYAATVKALQIRRATGGTK